MSDLVEIPNCWFCHAQAHLISQTQTTGGKESTAQIPGPLQLSADYVSIGRSDVQLVLSVVTSVSPGSEVIKLFSCSTELILKFILLINVKMPTIVGILTFMSRITCLPVFEF